jgi:hypothetical protein
MNQSLSISKFKLYLVYLTIIILVLLPFHAFLSIWLNSATGHYELVRLWKEILIFFLLLPGCITIYIKDKTVRSELAKNKIQILIVAYILLHITIGVWAYLHHQVSLKALSYSLIINLRLVVFLWVCMVLAFSSNFVVKNWEKILIMPAVVVIIFGLCQHFLLPVNFLKHFGYNQNTIAPYQTVDQSLNYVRIQSTLRGSNPLGAYLVLVMSGFFVWYLRASKKHKVKIFLGIIASSIVLFFTYSRSAWAGTILSIALIVWLSISLKIRKLFIAVSLVGLVLLFAGTYSLKNNTGFEDTFFHTSNQSRAATSSNFNHTAALTSGLKDIWRQPLGRGPGTAGPASVYNHNALRISENYFLQIGQEVGVLGLVIFCAIYFLVAKELWARKTHALSLVLFCSLIGLTFVAMFSHVWADDTIGLIWWGFAGYAISPGYNKRG